MVISMMNILKSLEQTCISVCYLSTGDEKPQTDPGDGRSALWDTAMLWRRHKQISSTWFNHRKVAGSIPLVCMSMGEILKPKLPLTCWLLWTKHLLKALNVSEVSSTVAPPLSLPAAATSIALPLYLYRHTHIHNIATPPAHLGETQHREGRTSGGSADQRARSSHGSRGFLSHLSRARDRGEGGGVCNERGWGFNLWDTWGAVNLTVRCHDNQRRQKHKKI